MTLSTACLEILDQLERTVGQIRPSDFGKASPTLSGSTVGQHLRHTLEFFLCLEKGFDSGTINYDKRDHDQLIENDKFIALASIRRIRDFVLSKSEDRELRLEVGYERNSDDCLTISTNYFRELTYNIEHTIHHMAIMKIGVRELAPYIELPAHFGIAASTVRYQEAAVPQHHK